MVTLTYMPTEHVPVLAAEVIRFSSPEPGDTVVDCTFGGGGHSRLIADRLGPEGTLICVDRDPIALDRFEQLAHEAVCETRFMRTDFVSALEELATEGVRPDVILFDLGVSSMQIDAWERGFSYSFDAPLDMRMDPDGEIDAKTILNEWPEARIAETLRNYGEEKHARSIAREVVARRPLETTSDFVDAVRAGVPRRSASAAAIRRSAASRRSGSPSTTSSASLTPPCRPHGICSLPAGVSPRSRFTPSRTAGSSASSSIVPAAASARPSSRSAAVVSSQRRN